MVTETYFEPVGQRAQQLDFDWQADERCHATVGDGRCELDAHGALRIINLGNDEKVEKDWAMQWGKSYFHSKVLMWWLQ